MTTLEVPKKRTLFSIEQDMLAFMDLMDEAGGEVTEESAAALEAIIAELGTDQATKCNGYVGMMKHFETQAAVAKATAEQFSRKAQTAENQLRRLKDRIKGYMELTGQAKIETSDGWVLAIQKNGGVVPLILDSTDPKNFPPSCSKIKVELDNAHIREMLEAGEQLDFARMGERGTSLRIR